MSYKIKKAGMPVLYLTESKNKEIVTRYLNGVIDDVYVKNIKKGNFNLIIKELKDFAIQEAKLSLMDCSILDLFDNQNKIKEKLSNIVLYTFNYSDGTKYNNIAIEALYENLLSGIAAINVSFLIKNKDTVFQLLREKDLI